MGGVSQRCVGGWRGQLTGRDGRSVPEVCWWMERCQAVAHPSIRVDVSQGDTMHDRATRDGRGAEGLVVAAWRALQRVALWFDRWEVDAAGCEAGVGGVWVVAAGWADGRTEGQRRGYGHSASSRRGQDHTADGTSARAGASFRSSISAERSPCALSCCACHCSVNAWSAVACSAAAELSASARSDRN